MKPLEFSVSVRSGNRTLAAITGFRFEQNQVTFLFGESGIGKSIISKALYGLLDPQELEVAINGQPYVDYLGQPWVRAIAQNSFFVFQEPSTHLNPLQKISAQLEEGSHHSDYQSEPITVCQGPITGVEIRTRSPLLLRGDREPRLE